MITEAARDFVAGVVALVLGASAALAGGPTGIPDPYYPTYGNEGYDVTHYTIDVKYRIAAGRLSGTTTVQAVALEDLSEFNLDFGLPVSHVTVDGNDASYSQDGLELTVTPGSPVLTANPFVVAVTYAGDPSEVFGPNALGGWFPTSDGAVVAGEPEVAAAWFPSNDHPSDKATYTIKLTVPKGKEAISNGKLRRRTVSGSWATWVWKETSPMVTYLAMAVIGDYRLERGRTPGGVPYLNAISEHLGGYRSAAERSLAITPSTVDFFTQKFGPYPFATAGGVLANWNEPFALENQSRPIYSKVFFSGGPDYEVVAHEIAHMWWGDSVSLEQWNDIWINEGLATWSSWYYLSRKVPGQPSLNGFFQFYYGLPGYWSVNLSDPGAGQEFHGAVYIRGALAVQALRTRIGEADFNELLRTWAETYRDGNASVEDFRALAESISGEDLTVFFDEWIVQTNKPQPSVELGFPDSMVP